MSDDLIKRLRNAVNYRVSGPDAGHAAALFHEAADALASSQEEIERLRKALEPFARARGHFDGYVRDEDTVDISLRHIRAHHVFAAARALASKAGAA